ALWQRPKRIAAARFELERVGETLVSRALDVVRDVRLAYADYAASITRARVAEEIVRERREIAQIVNARFRAGDISELETHASVVEARMAEERMMRFEQEASLAQERLRGLLSFGNDSRELKLIVQSRPLAPTADQIINVRASTQPADDSPAADESRSL